MAGARWWTAGPAQLAAARDRIAASLAEQSKARDSSPTRRRRWRRIALSSAWRTRWRTRTWVQENLPEEVDVKRACFAALDARRRPHAVLASSTSAIPASRFTENLAGRARCLVAHPVNPPHLVPVVELCGAPWTSPATLERAHAVMTDVGRFP